jgi:hypothetical protein
MAATPVTPVPALNSQVTTGGTAVNAFGPGPNGGFLQNPASANDQAISAAEDIVVNPISAAVAPGVSGGVNGPNFRIPPGGSWTVIAGQTTSTSINATTSGHKISGVSW